eukprot:80501-Rhodomonas_salina.2
MSGTDLGRIRLRMQYAMSDTDTAYHMLLGVGERCAVLRLGMVLPDTQEGEGNDKASEQADKVPNSITGTQAEKLPRSNTEPWYEHRVRCAMCRTDTSYCATHQL